MALKSSTSVLVRGKQKSFNTSIHRIEGYAKMKAGESDVATSQRMSRMLAATRSSRRLETELP